MATTPGTRKLQPIIIKRVKKTTHAHHGGAWDQPGGGSWPLSSGEGTRVPRWSSSSSRRCAPR